MSKIAFFEVKDWEKVYISQRLSGHELHFFPFELKQGCIEEVSDADIISVFIYSRITKETLACFPNLSAIATRSTGFDHIDLVAAKERGVKVCNVPTYGENTVAEHTFALILSLSRNVHKSYVRTLANNFSIDGLTGFDLKAKTIGVIGSGFIGKHVIRIAKGFGMNVLVFDIRQDPGLAAGLGFSYADFDSLLRQSDIVTLHLPYNKHTHHIISSDKLALMKKGAILINTARGGLVDTDAMLLALEQGQLGGAGLDVIEGEELIMEEKALLHDTGNPGRWRSIVRDHRIVRMENVVFTPHNAFNSTEALQRILDTSIDNIQSVLSDDPVNIVEVKNEPGA